tara:strand:+ start:116 stop:643 length:528 start_codon:yes stop_codon:yes gene_type:complete
MQIMIKKNTTIALIIFTLITSVLNIQIVNADDGSNVISGIITSITKNSEDHLESLEIIDNKGNIIKLNVSSENINTEYGLENITGERWVSNQKESPKKAYQVLLDHQERLIPITVTKRDEIALKIVEKEKRNLDTNLTYLAVVFALAWLSFFGYIYIIERRHKILESKIKTNLNE